MPLCINVDENDLTPGEKRDDPANQQPFPVPALSNNRTGPALNRPQLAPTPPPVHPALPILRANRDFSKLAFEGITRQTTRRLYAVDKHPTETRK